MKINVFLWIYVFLISSCNALYTSNRWVFDRHAAILSSSLKTRIGIPDGPVAKNLLCNTGCTGSILVRNKIPSVTGN